MPIMDRMAIIAFRARMAPIVWMVMIDVLALIAVLVVIARDKRNGYEIAKITKIAEMAVLMAITIGGIIWFICLLAVIATTFMILFYLP